LIELLFSPEKADSFLGDLQERFIRIAHRHDVRFARRWYWKQALAQVWHTLPGWLKLAAIEWLRRLV
jgi:hypothetical protein